MLTPTYISITSFYLLILISYPHFPLKILFLVVFHVPLSIYIFSSIPSILFFSNSSFSSISILLSAFILFSLLISMPSHMMTSCIDLLSYSVEQIGNYYESNSKGLIESTIYIVQISHFIVHSNHTESLLYYLNLICYLYCFFPLSYLFYCLYFNLV